jgi:hypothetical protein
MRCNKCDYDNKAEAVYCKNCGTKLIYNESFVEKINGHINLVAVFLGSIISILILFIGAILFSGVITSGSTIVSLYVGLVVLAMAFFGSIVTGILGCKNINEGYINGSFLGLIIIVITGFALGVVLFVFIGIFASILNSLSSFASTASTTSSSGSIFSWINLVEAIFLVIFTIISGAMGGAFGVFIKYGLKQI